MNRERLTACVVLGSLIVPIPLMPVTRYAFNHNNLSYGTWLTFTCFSVALWPLMMMLAWGHYLKRLRVRCPACQAKSLALTHWFSCSPPPDVSFYKCDCCGIQYVQQHTGSGRPLVPLLGSGWEDRSLWDPTPLDSV